MSRTTVTISAASKIVQEKLKKKFSAKSADALILEFEKHLLGILEPAKDAAEEFDSEEEVQGPEKRRKKTNFRTPLFSFKILEERPEMLKFYTGYDGKRILMLTDRLAQVRISLFSFFFSCLLLLAYQTFLRLC
jgi:hypothetical protein